MFALVDFVFQFLLPNQIFFFYKSLTQRPQSETLLGRITFNVWY